MDDDKKTYAVWVGSLTDQIEEDDIYNEFKRCGPISNVKIMYDEDGKSKGYGFVNFFSKEVAEVAAEDMNETSILGVQIKTSFKDKNHKKKDIRPLTDCAHFINGQCNSKNCIFRHNIKAKQHPVICYAWLQKKCFDENCDQQHPSKQVKKADSKPEKKIKITRCDSHDEFKCFGQCGDALCSHNHYISEEGLRNHIVSPASPYKEKPFSPLCQECGIVFLSSVDKQNHTHNGDDFGDTPTKMEAESDDTAETSDSPEPIGIYWDIENCPVKGKSTAAFVQRIREVYLPGRSEIEFVCVCDTRRQKKHIVDELNKAEVHVVHVDATAKNAADDKLKQLMLKFAKIVRHPASVLLISGDVNFSLVLSDLKHTSKFHVILLHNASASKHLLQFAHETRRFDAFIVDLPLSHTPQVGTKQQPPLVRTSDLLINNLPFGMDPRRIASRLSFLSDNCGGRVGQFFSSAPDNKLSCVVGFPSADKADRAAVRLEGQNVCGALISVTPYWGATNMARPPPPVLSPRTGPVRTNLSKTSSVGTLNAPMQPAPGQFEVGALYGATNMARPPPPVLSPRTGPVRTNLSKTSSVGTLNASMQPAPGRFEVGALYGATNMARPPPPVLSPRTGPVRTNLSKTSSVGTLNASMQPAPGRFEVGALYGDTNMARSPPPVPTPKTGPVGANLSKTSSVGTLNAPMQPAPMQPAPGRFEVGALYGDTSMARSPAPVPTPKTGPVGANLSKTEGKFEVKVLAVFQSSSHWLPIQVFLAKFKKMYKETFNIFQLNKLSNLLFMDGKPGRKFVCLLNAETGTVKLKIDPNLFNQFLREILQEHKRKVPLSGIPGLFWSYKQCNLMHDDYGSSLFSLVQNCPETSLIRNPSWGFAVCKIRPLFAGLKPSDFVADLKLLLQNSTNFQIPLDQWTTRYNHFFGANFLPMEYGASDIEELLAGIPNVAKVVTVKGIETIALTPKYIKTMRTSQFSDLLKSQKNNLIYMKYFAVEYYKFFGCKVLPDPKIPKLCALVRSLKANLWIDDSKKNNEFLKFKKEPSPFTAFKKDLLALLRSKPDRRISLDKLLTEYEEFHGKTVILTNLGFKHPNDLFKALEKDVQIVNVDQMTYICLVPKTPPMDPAWKEVVDLLNGSADNLLLLRDVPNGGGKALLASVPKSVKLLGFGLSQCFILARKLKSLLKEDSDTIIDKILYASGQFSLPVTEVADKLNGDEKQKLMALQNYVENRGGTEIIEGSLLVLRQEQALKFFCNETVALLAEKPGNQLSVMKFCGDYHKKYGRQYKVANFGFKKAIELFNALPDNMVEVVEVDGNPCVALTRRATFLDEAVSLLYVNNGAVLLNQFLDIHSKNFDFFRPTDYGYASLSAFFQSFPERFLLLPTSISALVISKEFLGPVEEAAVATVHASAAKNAVKSKAEDDAKIPPPTSSGNIDSDDEPVIIESEELPGCSFMPDLEDGQTDTDQESFSGSEMDLLDLSDAESSNNKEWWMADDVQDLLPPPEIEPERVSRGYSATAKDLISLWDNGVAKKPD